VKASGGRREIVRVATAIQVNPQSISVDRRLRTPKGDQMKMQKLMTARRILLALTLGVMITVPTVTLRAQSSDEPTTVQNAVQEGGILDLLEQFRQAQAQRLEGSWALTVTPVVPPGVPPVPPFRTYLTISRGGACIGSDRTRPFGSPQHGTWAYVSGDEFAATQIQDLFDVMGNFVGTLKVRQRIILIGKDEFVSVANAETRDAAGNIVTSRCATTHGERIVIEPLAAQCQVITPPQ
jgi:hypothetical protein